MMTLAFWRLCSRLSQFRWSIMEDMNTSTNDNNLCSIRDTWLRKTNNWYRFKGFIEEIYWFVPNPLRRHLIKNDRYNVPSSVTVNKDTKVWQISDTWLMIDHIKRVQKDTTEFWKIAQRMQLVLNQPQKDRKYNGQKDKRWYKQHYKENLWLSNTHLKTGREIWGGKL